MRRLVVLLSAAFLALAGLRAAEPLRRTAANRSAGTLHGWRMRVWESTSERPDSSATAMAQDEAGYLWFGTFNGLVRFDGERMKGHWNSTTPGLPDDGVVNLFRDRLNRIWVSTYRGPTVVGPSGVPVSQGFDTGWPAGQFVRSWFESVDGALLVVTFQRDVLRFRNDRWEILPRVPEPDNEGIQLADSASGRLLALRRDAAYELLEGRWMRVPSPLGEGGDLVIGACPGRDGGRWILTSRELVLRKGGVVVERRPFGDWAGTVWSMTEDSEGAVWVCGNTSGMVRVAKDGSVLRFGTSNGLPVNDVRFVFEDRQGVLWVGTSGGGLLRLIRAVVDGLGTEHGLPQPSIQAILAEPDGSVLVSAQGEGVFRWDGRRFERPTEPHWQPFLRDQLFVTSLARAGDDDYWAGVNNGIVVHLFRGRIEQHQPVDTVGRYENRTELFIDHRKRVWAGFSRELMVHEGGEWRRHGSDGDGLAEIRSFAQAPGGGPIYAGSLSRGLFVLDGDAIRRMGLADGLPSESVRALCMDRTGTLWVATDRGLARLKDGRIRPVAPMRPFAPDGIIRMLADGSGHLWASAAGGLLMLSLDDLNRACDSTTDRLPHRWFTPLDGVPFSEFPPAAAALPDGSLWFGTIRGVATVDPRRLTPDRRSIGLRFEEVSYTEPSGRRQTVEFSPGGGIRRLEIPRGSRRIEVRFTAFDTAAPHLIGFEYRIEGLDADWVDIGNRREVELDGLPAGEHPFRLRAVSAGGVLDPVEASIVLTEHPALWETRWFQAAALLVLGMAVALVASRLENRRLALRRKALARDEALLRESTEAVRKQLLFRRLLDASREGIYVLHPEDGRFIDANAAAERMLGYSREELLGLRAGDIAAPDRPLDWKEQYERIRRSGHLTFESRQRRRDGTLLPVEVDISTTSLDTDTDGYVIGFVRDITERVAAREKQAGLERQLREAQKMEAIGCLAGGVAHDFNNLLQAIGGFAELARLDAPDRERDEHLAEIGRTVGRATQLTRQLLAFSRKHEVEVRQIHLNEVVENSTRLLERLLGADIQVVFNGAANLPPLLGDAGLIDQVLLNLAVNARDAMPSGGRLEIATGESEFIGSGTPAWARPGRFVRLSVRDTGCGIEPEVLDRIFEPFFTTKPQGKGTGLGLSVVYGNVQQHDGFLRVDSTPGRGTVFEVYFPVLAEGSDSNPSDSSLRRAPGRGSILFCDDEPGVRKAGRLILEGAGYTVVATASGAEAVRAVSDNPDLFSLVVMDVMMPGMSGPEAVREIRGRVPTLPVLFITGFSGTSLPPAAERPADCRVLRKPYSRTDLIDAVEQLLGRATGEVRPPGSVRTDGPRPSGV
jgi:two-component system, cell cycle sensor histidine kinase and response regulator CckA